MVTLEEIQAILKSMHIPAKILPSGTLSVFPGYSSLVEIEIVNSRIYITQEPLRKLDVQADSISQKPDRLDFLNKSVVVYSLHAVKSTNNKNTNVIGGNCMPKTKETQTEVGFVTPNVNEKPIQEIVHVVEGMRAIRTQEDYEKAGELRKALKTLEKEVEDAFKPIIDHAKKMKAKYLEPIKEAQEKLSSLLQKYLEHLQEQAQKKAEAEREKLLKQAEKAQEMSPEKAENLRALAQSVDTKTFLKEKASSDSLSVRTEIAYEVFDINALPDEYVIREPNRAKINAVVKEKGMATEIPGVRVFERVIPVSR